MRCSAYLSQRFLFQIEFQWRHDTEWNAGLRSFLAQAVLFTCIHKATAAPLSRRDHLLDYWLALAGTWKQLAIESCDRSLLPITFRDFPVGSCGDATLLLGCYLRERGLGEFDQVTGERGVAADGTWQSHAWLEGNGVFVDITSDQFNELTESVQVGLRRHLQNAFQVTGRQRADFRTYDERTSSTLEGAYKDILRQYLSPKPAAGKYSEHVGRRRNNDLEGLIGLAR